jgi:hypothetical protein
MVYTTQKVTTGAGLIACDIWGVFALYLVTYAYSHKVSSTFDLLAVSPIGSSLVPTAYRGFHPTRVLKTRFKN